jgi:ribose transport system permease protein
MKVIKFFRQYAIFTVLIVIFCIFSIASPSFLQISNLLDLTRQVSMLGIAAVGMTFVVLLGGIDLSIGSLISLINVVTAYIMVHMGFNPWLACIIGLIMTTFVGFVNGWIVANVGIPAIIVTLGGMTAFSGVAYKISGGLPIYGFPKEFSLIGQGYLWIIPIPIIIMAAIFALGSFILSKTYFGRYFYAVGGNEEASRLSGIKIKNIKYLAYTLSGFFAGIAGIVMLSRTNSAQPMAGQGFELDALTAAVLGGVSVSGGFGKISNVVAGTLIIGVLTNGFVLLNIDSYTQMIIKGSVLLFAVGYDCIQKKQKKQKKTKVTAAKIELTQEELVNR